VQGLKSSFVDSEPAMDRAIEHLTKAVERDPEFALAHAGLARVFVDKYRIIAGWGVWQDKAEHHCRRALEIDALLPEGHLAKGYILWSQAKNYAYREAIAEFGRALQLQANLDGAHGQLGLIFSHIGRLEEGLAAFQKAHRVNPQNSWSRWAGLAHLWAGEFEAANSECEAWLRDSPGSKYARWLRPQPLLLTGDLKAAESVLSETLAEYPDEPLFVSLQGILCALRGEAEPALECARVACSSARSFGHTHHTLYQVACIYSLLERRREALGWLERAASTGFRCWSFFRKDPTLSSLRQLPEFDDYVAHIEHDARSVPALPA
jgi:tetratricopeptide (TPR) repeat protein